MRLRVHRTEHRSQPFVTRSTLVMGSVAFLLLMLTVLSSSCQSKTEVETKVSDRAETKTAPPVSVQATTNKQPDNWQRMKECAEQTERDAKRGGWVEGQRNGNVTTTGWRNHYSPKYGRCYVVVSYMNHAAETNHALPLSYYELYDAFEARLLSTCIDAATFETNMFCSTQTDHGPSFDCRACRTFTNDRMDN